MNDLAARARAIFDMTALSVDDVEPELVTVVVADQLREAAGLFRYFLDLGSVAPESQGDIEHLIGAALFYADAVVTRPYDELTFDGKPQPIHKICATLCDDIIGVVRGIDFSAKPEWRDFYEFIASRFAEYAEFLRQSPENMVRWT